LELLNAFNDLSASYIIVQLLEGMVLGFFIGMTGNVRQKSIVVFLPNQNVGGLGVLFGDLPLLASQAEDRVNFDKRIPPFVMLS